MKRILPFLCLLLVAYGCQEDIVNEPDYVRVEFLQPENGQTVRDSVLRVIISLEKNCGCVAHAEFFVDDSLYVTDDTPAYYFDWDIRKVTGEHRLVVHGYVIGRAEGRDTVRVTINP
jgi:hypothetical protein